MGLPTKLKNFALFVDGENYMGEVPEVTLPTLKRKLEDYRSGGMNMPIDLDFGMDKMEMEWTAAGWIKGLLKQWGSGRHDAVLLRFAGAAQSDDSEQVLAVEAVVRGRHTEFNPGNAKGGEKTEIKMKTSASYYKLTVNGEVLLEIDAVNMIENVYGVDRLAQVRAALGI